MSPSDKEEVTSQGGSESNSVSKEHAPEKVECHEAGKMLKHVVQYFEINILNDQE